MTNGFKAIKVHQKNGESFAQIERATTDDLIQEGVLIKAHYSSLNYKDALAITGRGAILKNFPMIPGIDVSGEVLSKDCKNWTPGQKVLVTGCGLGETNHGGFAELVRVPSDWPVLIPTSLSAKDVMVIGTAGFTAALAIHRLIQMNQSPAMGPMVVTGASGGVGLFAVYLLKKLGFEVYAVTQKVAYSDLLMHLGATKVIPLDKLSLAAKPLAKGIYGGAIDNLGGKVLAGLLPQINMWGNIASIGMAQSAEFKSTVFPHILRGVSLIGISSTNCPIPLRHEIWQKLGTDWKIEALNSIQTEEIHLDQVIAKAYDMLDQKTHGRYIVKIGS